MIEKIKNLKKNEKIIIVVMILAVLYGAYTVLTTMSNDSKNARLSKPQGHSLDVEALTGTVSAVLKDSKASMVDAYIIARAETEWAVDPFYLSDTSLDRGNQINFNYTGYIEYGSRRFAVINGLDYGTGDELEAGGFIVKNIRPNEVVIEDKGKLEKITIPFVEE